MKNVLFLAPLFILMSCQPTKTVEPEASSGNINVYAPYMWSTSAFPRNLKISNSFSNSEVTAIQEMSSEWEDSVENKKNFFTNTERTPEVSSPTLNLDNLGDDGILGIYKLDTWPFDGIALAVTQIFGRRYNVGASNEYVKIEHADILLNNVDYDFRLTNTVAEDFDLRTVILHEMGHFLGMNHNITTTNSVMYPSVGKSASKRTPNVVDISELASKYNISLSSSSAGAIVAEKPVYKPAPNDPGQSIRILIELRSDGDCIHKENGRELYRHSIVKK